MSKGLRSSCTLGRELYYGVLIKAMSTDRKKPRLLGVLLCMQLLLSSCFPITTITPSKSTSKATEITRLSPTFTIEHTPTKETLETYELTPQAEIIYTPSLKIEETPEILFPTDIYPISTPAQPGWWGHQECPNSSNLEISDEPPANEIILKILKVLFSSRDLLAKQTVTDRAFWGQLSEGGTNENPTTDYIESIAPALDSGYGELLTNLCGEDVVNKSWWVKICPGPCKSSSSESLKVDYYLIKREGIWLVWTRF